MATNYSPTIVTDGAVLVGDALMPSISEPGTRLYNRAGVDSADVKLLIHGNVGSSQNFTDSSLSNHTITVGGASTHSTTQSKFSGGSIYFNGSGDYLNIPDSSDFDFGSGAFTVDCWIYFTVSTGSGYYGLAVQGRGGGSGSSSWWFGLHENKISTWLSTSGSGWSTWSDDTGPALNDGAWHHLAWVGDGTNVKGYVDGTLYHTITQGTLNNSTRTVDIGASRNSSEDYTTQAFGLSQGFMDEVRIIKGVSLWTQNFTPPARRDTLSISDGMMYNGSCLDFDGTDDYVSGASSLWSANGDQTFACWLKVDNISNSRLIFDTSGTGDFSVQTDGQIRVHPVASNWADTTSSISTGVWYHIVLTQTSTARKIYVDGVEQTLAVGGGSPQTVAWNSPTSALRIGHAGAYRDEFDGQMADARIYSAALSAANVKEIYNDSKVILPSNVAQTNLKCWLPMVDGAGTIAYDGSGNGNDGTLTNMTSADWLTGQTGPPQLVEGYNRPMRFDNPQYIEVPQDSTLDVGTSDFTFAAWTFLETGSEPNIAMQFAGAGGWRMVGASGKVRFSVFDNGWTNYASMDISPALTLDQWNHVAVSVDRDGNAQSYINGVAKTYLNVSGVTGTLTNTYPLRFGAGSYTSGAPTGDYIAGTINEAIMYIGTALNAADIAALAATGPNGGPLPPDPTTMTYSTTSYSSSYLKGYWRNDGIVTWTDRSGNGNTGTANGSPNALLFKQGYNGSASTSTGRDNQGFPLKFKDVGAVGFDADATDYYINIAASTELDNIWDGGGTTDTWIYPVSDGESSGGRIYEKTQWNLLTHSQSGTNVKLQFYFKFTGTDGTWDTEDVVVPLNEWSHIVVTYDADNVANNPTIYLNGVAYTVGDGLVESTTPTSVREDDAGEALQIGNNDTPSRTFDGQIYGLKIYNRTLSQAEITQNFNAQRSRFT